MSDSAIRDLERAAAEGDMQARERLTREALRRGAGVLVTAWAGDAERPVLSLDPRPPGFVLVRVTRIERYEKERVFLVWAQVAPTPERMFDLVFELHEVIRRTGDILEIATGRCVSNGYARGARVKCLELGE